VGELIVAKINTNVAYPAGSIEKHEVTLFKFILPDAPALLILCTCGARNLDIVHLFEKKGTEGGTVDTHF
jgi:hypothetical protein